MYTLSENCPRKDVCVQNGKGLIHRVSTATAACSPT